MWKKIKAGGLGATLRPTMDSRQNPCRGEEEAGESSIFLTLNLELIYVKII
jgi:hypothetical protein